MHFILFYVIYAKFTHEIRYRKEKSDEPQAYQDRNKVTRLLLLKNIMYNL